jgi:hypothetical protein
MKRKVCFILVFYLLIISGYGEMVSAATKENSFEKGLFEIGYKPVEEAIDDFEKHYKRKLQLPFKIPPVTFTHIFGRFSDLDGDMNDTFQIMFINDKSPENHYKIDVRPTKYRISINNKDKIKTYELNDGKMAYFTETRVSNLLIFEKGNWQYMIGIDKRISDKITAETLVNIANSLQYPITEN